MKIAYILLCHKNSKQINMLIGELLKNDADIFIHLDKKSNIKNEIIKNERIYILPDEQSYSVNWGGNDMVLATLSLIRYVKNTKNNYDYIWLLSGQDFPIRSADKIEKFLDENKGYNFIEILDNDSKQYRIYKKRLEIWYPSWITRNKVYIKIIKRIYMLITGGFEYTFKLFRRKKSFDFDFQFGSQWWTLTSDCAFSILEYCDNNPGFVNYFEHCMIPDECFFQTIFMSSKYANKKKNYLTFVNWKNNRRSPETLTIEDYDKLSSIENKFFARKFDITIDKRIIEKIKEFGDEKNEH